MELCVYYSCGLSTATIEYSVCLCVCVHSNLKTNGNLKNNGSIHLKLKTSCSI